MAKQKGDEELPPEVQAEVDKIRAEEGGEQEAPPEEEAQPERVLVPSSRRGQRQQERDAALIEARENSKQAREAVEELRRQREEDRAMLAEMRGLLQGQAQSRQTTVDGKSKDDDDDDYEDKYRRQMKKAEEALADGKLAEYHERMTRAMDARAKGREKEILKRIPQQQQAPQPKPAWVTAIESQFPDVLTHANGTNTVVAFHQMDPAQAGPEKLQRAFEEARKRLFPEKVQQAQANNDRQRQLLSGGPVNGGGPRGVSGKNDAHVKVPKNYREIAARAGMKPEEYVAAYAAMNPHEVERG